MFSSKDIIPGLRFLPRVLSGIVCKYYINQIQKRVGTKFDVIASFDNSRLFNLMYIKEPLKISFQIEYDTVQNRDIVCKYSDYVFCTHDLINDCVKFSIPYKRMNLSAN